MITRPMLAATLEDPATLRYPALVTPKLDGIRCIITPEGAVSRKFKPIPNNYIRSKLIELPVGLDGELMLRGDYTFNEIQSAVMSQDGTPDFEYWIFDYYSNRGYAQRMRELRELTLPDYCRRLFPCCVQDLKQFLVMEKTYLEQNYEGIMIRSEHSPYKCGRSTLREGYLLKFKRFETAEALVCGFAEEMANDNEATTNELGYTKRSTNQENLVGKNTLGALICKDMSTDVELRIGSGFTAEQRREIWENRSRYYDRVVTYRFQPHGVKDAPRFPTFLHFRED